MNTLGIHNFTHNHFLQRCGEISPLSFSLITEWIISDDLKGCCCCYTSYHYEGLAYKCSDRLKNRRQQWSSLQDRRSWAGSPTLVVKTEASRVWCELTSCVSWNWRWCLCCRCAPAGRWWRSRRRGLGSAFRGFSVLGWAPELWPIQLSPVLLRCCCSPHCFQRHRRQLHSSGEWGGTAAGCGCGSAQGCLIQGSAGCGRASGLGSPG